MSDSASFVGIGLQLRTVNVQSSIVVRARYSTDPKAVNSANADDALRTANYTITGDSPVVIDAVAPVGGDTQAFDLILSYPIGIGTWTLTVANTIETPSGATIAAPYSLTFEVTETALYQSLDGGAAADDQDAIVRKHLSPTLQGPNWDAVIAALEESDRFNRDNAKRVFKQLFATTAGGKYLRRIGSSRGVQDPVAVGLDDEGYRKLIFASYNKLVIEGVLDIVEVFYGLDSVRAHLTTGVGGPYQLEDGQTLVIDLRGTEYTVTFREENFNSIGSASALEVAVYITQELSVLGAKAFALSFTDAATGTDMIKLYSDTRGISSYVTIVRGTAQNALQFQTLLSDVYTGTV